MLNETGKKMAAALAELEEVQKAATGTPSIEITQDHYGYYAQAIDALARATGRTGKEGHVLAAEALRLAGGNGRGIDAAMFAMFGYSEYDAFNRMF